MSRCPNCGSDDFIDTARVEECRSCGYSFYYGDATAPLGSRESLSSNHWDRRRDGGREGDQP